MLKKRLQNIVLLITLTLGLAACGTPTATPLPPTETPAPTTRVAGTTRTAAGNPTVATNITTRAASTTRSAQATTATSNQSGQSNQVEDLTATYPEKTVIHTFTDNEGRSVKLIYGRGAGHGGDYGWAHILGKHVNGIWYDGGTITTFPKALGTKTPQDVINLIGKSLEDKNPDNQGGGRRGYNYAVPNTNRDVFTVVGNDGTIITSYPVPHGSKDED